ncbi:alkene reductase [Noviherbaspirillum sp. Root189]|uniref:alkene reductase n=1 Tax=Noviherbaspirillum sp. Root189 TaxID=1736487 RepID=UPI00070A15D9|nr:alkene reductase [Noviherbaspirillum sp. Root189]KRB83854.1 alkene reductase [Noviherbaspirillum sp. Root189]
MSDHLFAPLRLGELTLPNRIVMPPMTRARAADGEVPTDMMAQYYQQRASAGLIISEGTQINRQGQGYAWTPGIYTAEQIEGWRKVTAAVHRAGGRIFAQLWHVGRLSHFSLQPSGQAPVAPSALVADGVQVFIDPQSLGATHGTHGDGQKVQHSPPRALATAEVGILVRDFAAAAESALTAGFDGVELHGANGYLINQFLDSGSNHRTDIYGGSLRNRLRFLEEVAHAVATVVGPERVGVRLSPLITAQGTTDATPESTYLAAARLLDKLGIGYLHIAEADWDDAPLMPATFKEALRQIYSGVMIYSGHYDRSRADEALALGWTDLVGFGRPFIANPDLPRRLQLGASLNTGNPALYFGGSAQGYIDYPYLDDVLG